MRPPSTREQWAPAVERLPFVDDTVGKLECTSSLHVFDHYTQHQRFCLINTNITEVAFVGVMPLQ